MKKLLLMLAIPFVIGSACMLTSPAEHHTPTQPPPQATESYPAVVGPDPSYKVAAFYYPWYRNMETDGNWIHWQQFDFQPPKSIASDYYPVLGAYSSNDPKVVAQHMVWLREAGIGVIIVSWQGQGSREDKTVPLIMKMAERYKIKVIFQIEPYEGRTAQSLLDDVQYLYQQYGGSSAFFRTTLSTRYHPGNQPKGMFFMWQAEFQQMNQFPVTADYWQQTMDAIHALPEHPLVIANSLQGSWINNGHFDGLNNYITLHLEEENGFNWARTLPANSLYIPSVTPGNSARRIQYPESTYISRQDGETYNQQWTAALGTGVEPAMMTITSFNEWHEGSMIEPIATGMDDGAGYAYADFGVLPPDGYLTLTHSWIDKYLVMQQNQPPTYRVRIEINTTADWTTLNVVSGGIWIRPERISTSDSVTLADMQAGDRLTLMQTLDDAFAGKNVQMTWDVLFTQLDASQDLILQIDRGSIGVTQVAIYNYTGEQPVEIKTFKWGGITTDRNSLPIHVSPADIMKSFP